MSIEQPTDAELLFEEAMDTTVQVLEIKGNDSKFRLSLIGSSKTNQDEHVIEYEQHHWMLRVMDGKIRIDAAIRWGGEEGLETTESVQYFNNIEEYKHFLKELKEKYESKTI